jgi:hypothetical protein
MTATVIFAVKRDRENLWLHRSFFLMPVEDRALLNVRHRTRSISQVERGELKRGERS